MDDQFIDQSNGRFIISFIDQLVLFVVEAAAGSSFLVNIIGHVTTHAFLGFFLLRRQAPFSQSMSSYIMTNRFFIVLWPFIATARAFSSLNIVQNDKINLVLLMFVVYHSGRSQLLAGQRP